MSDFKIKNPMKGMQTKGVTQGPGGLPPNIGVMSSYNPDSPTNGGVPYAGSSPNKGFFSKIAKALNPVSHVKKLMGMGRRMGLPGMGGGGGGCPPGPRGMMGRMMRRGPMGPFGGGLFSDIRLKDNISQTGYSKSGITMYKFSYKGDDKVWSGVMAQDLLAMGKENAVHKDKETGYYKVDYSKIDVEMKPLN